MMRKVEIFIDFEVEQPEAFNTIAFQNAIGYLSSWAAHSYSSVKIYKEGDDGCMVAVYRKDETQSKVDYTIGAVWRNEEKPKKGYYSFHS